MKKTRWMKFLGAGNLIFSLTVLILLALIILLFNQASFFFTPLLVIVSNIIAPAILALLLYYLFSPLIDFLQKHGVKRIYGIILLYFIIFALIVVGIGSLYPLLADQVVDFLDDFPELFASINESIRSTTDNLPFGASIEGFIDQGEEFLSKLPSNAQSYLTEGFTGLSKVIQSVSNVVVTMVVAPIILFFLLKDDEEFAEKILAMCPPKWREDLKSLSSQINNQVSAYVKGQLIIATALGVMVFISFNLIGLKYSGVLAVITGFTSVIPYLGPILAFTPAVVIALSSSWWMLVKLLIVWMLVQFLEGNVIQPNVMGKQLNIHPLTIIIVLLVAGDLLGLVGLILGVPLYAILRVIVRFIFKQFKARYNRYYGDLAGEYEMEE